MPNIVLFAGYARSGKNTAAEALLQYGYQETSFAFPIRRIVYWLFDLDSSQLGNKAYEESVVLPGNRSVRDALIFFGEGARKLWPDIWAQKCYRTVAGIVKEEGKDVVITDLRRLNEAQALDLLADKNNKVYFIYIENPRLKITEKTFIPGIRKRTKLYSSGPEREVEKLKSWIEKHPNGWVINNSRSIEYLHEQVLAVVEAGR